jgi:hypothetical protein
MPWVRDAHLDGVKIAVTRKQPTKKRISAHAALTNVSRGFREVSEAMSR